MNSKNVYEIPKNKLLIIRFPIIKAFINLF
jgi:hypothetical protein